MLVFCIQHEEDLVFVMNFTQRQALGFVNLASSAQHGHGF